MIDTYQDKRLRLVSLVDMLARIEKPALNLGQVFDLAAKGEIRLYARLPPDKVAYVDGLMPVMTPRRLGRHLEGASWHVSFYSPQFSLIHPEVTHIVLDPDQAEELKARGLTEDMAFASGLSPHSDSTLSQAGWWMPCQFDASLVICPVLPTPASDIERRKQRVRRTLLKVTPDDVYIDEHVVALLQDSRASITDDPYYLRQRAPGVYILYRAAETYHGALQAKQITFDEVQDKILAQLPELSDANVKHAAKFLNPRHRRNSGLPPEKQKSFDPDVLVDPKFKARYRQADFINDALALILYATDQWLDALARFKLRATEIRPTRKNVSDHFQELGFQENEADALTVLILFRHSVNRT